MLKYIFFSFSKSYNFWGSVLSSLRVCFHNIHRLSLGHQRSNWIYEPDIPVSHGSPQKFVTAWTLPTKILEMIHPERFTLKIPVLSNRRIYQNSGGDKKFQPLVQLPKNEESKTAIISPHGTAAAPFHVGVLSQNVGRFHPFMAFCPGREKDMWSTAIISPHGTAAAPFHVGVLRQIFGRFSPFHGILPWTWKRDVKHRLGALLVPLHPRQTPQPHPPLSWHSITCPSLNLDWSTKADRDTTWLIRQGFVIMEGLTDS